MARNVQFTVLTDRSEGGSSLRDGEIELMVNTEPSCYIALANLFEKTTRTCALIHVINS